MGKKTKSKTSASKDTAEEVASVPAILTGDAPVDPLLASLFEKSVGFFLLILCVVFSHVEIIPGFLDLTY